MSLNVGNNLNKAKAYKKVAKNYYDAVDILNSKKLAFGEPAVVPFYYPDESDLDRQIKLAIGYGSINGGVEVMTNLNQDSSIDLNDYYNKHETDNLLDAKANKSALSGMMSYPLLSTLEDGRQEFQAIVNSLDTPFSMIIPAPADVDKAYVDRQVAAAKPMVVNTIPDEETGTPTAADKPFAEVLAWAKAGGTVMLRESPDEDSATEYPLIYHDASMLQFRLAPESTFVVGFDLYEDETLEYIEDSSAQESIDMIGERVDALEDAKANKSEVYKKQEVEVLIGNKIGIGDMSTAIHNALFQSQTTLYLYREGADRMNPPYTPFSGGPTTKWATLPLGILREHIVEFSFDDGATWYSQSTSLRAVAVVDGKVYWSVDSSALSPPPEPSDTLQIKVVGVVEKLQNQIDSLDARVTALENK